jgi:protein-L-isoaspartate(D-aspartate) O-methyltransferase
MGPRAFAALLPLVLLAAPPDFAARRRQLVDAIAEDVRFTARAIGKSELDEHVLAAMSRVPRHEFVPEALRAAAYENRPLPIGYGQTISQPFIVALMTDLLRAGKGAVVLEVGTGSGYQAAVLAELGARVHSVEIVPQLAQQAAGRLARLGYESVEVRAGDGYDGWPERGPFDGIVVTAAATHIPPPLVQQLKPGGRMVVPLGGAFMVQQLTLVTKSAAGKVQTRQLLPVAFVPLTGRH